MKKQILYSKATNTLIMETVTVPKEEYERLKKESEVDIELVNKIKKSLEDIKHDRIKEWKEE